MRNLIFQNMVTLDGFFEGPDGEINWHNVDEEFNTYALEFLDSVDALLFGRKTYQLMASYWPTPSALSDDPFVAEKMNSLPKYVASRTLLNVDWANSHLLQGNVQNEVTRLKQQPGKSVAMFGSADLAGTLISDGLIDEFRIIVNPVLLGRGRPLFGRVDKRLHLQLSDERRFVSGNVLLTYHPVLT